MTTATLPATPHQHRLSAPFAVLFLALLAATAFEVAKHGHLGLAVLGGLGPDLALLAGLAPGLAPGQLHPRAVPLYNALHRFAGPVVLLVLATTGVLGLPWFILGLGWATHIAMDRAAGYRLRDRDGWIR
jgi:hypothetical protein